MWCEGSLRRYWCYLSSPGPRSKGRLCPGVFALFAETPATRYTMYISMMAIDHQPCYNAHNQGQDAPEALWGQVSRRTRRWSGGEGSGRHRVRPWFTAPWWSLTTTPRPTIMVTKTKTKTLGWGGCQTFLRCDRWGRGCSCPRWASRRGSPRGGPPCDRWCPATLSTWSSWSSRSRITYCTEQCWCMMWKYRYFHLFVS